MNRTDDVSRQLIDGIQPARSASYRLQGALREQETGLRGTSSPQIANSLRRTTTASGTKTRPQPTFEHASATAAT